MKLPLLICAIGIAALSLSAQNVPPFPEKPEPNPVRKKDFREYDSGLDLPRETGKWQNGPEGKWFVNFDDALEKAWKQKKCLFLLSTGSDWCGYCIKLHENVLKKSKFRNFASKNLILVYLDSPSKKPLPPEQAKHNAAVKKALFGNSGCVPHAVILSPTGQYLGDIMGYRDEDNYLKALMDIVPKELSLPKKFDTKTMQDEFKRSRTPGYKPAAPGKTKRKQQPDGNVRR